MEDDDDFMCLGNVSSLQEVCRNSTEGTGRDSEKPSEREPAPVCDSSEDDALSTASECGSSGDLEDYLCEISEIEQSSLHSTTPSPSVVDAIQAPPRTNLDKLSSQPPRKDTVNVTSRLTHCVQSMVSLERSEPAGGMLVEPSGIDKASMVLDLFQCQEKWASGEQLKSGIIESSGTIILTVQALVNQWTCLLRKNGPRGLKVFSGNVARQNIFEIAQYDFVVTSYTHIYRHLFSDPDCPLTKNMFFISWERVIYDEVSTISSYGKSPFEYLAFGLLNAKHRWVFSSSQHLTGEAFKKLSLYVFLLQHPVLSRVESWHNLSLRQAMSFEDKIVALRNIELPEQEEFHSSLFLEALKPLKVENPIRPCERLMSPFSSGSPMVFLQRVKVASSPQESTFYRCVFNTIRRKLSAEKKSISSVASSNNGMDYFTKLLRVQILDLCLQLRKACASPQIALQYLYSNRGIFRNLTEVRTPTDIPTPREEAKVRMLKKKLGLVEEKKGTDTCTKSPQKRSYAIETLRSLEGGSSILEKSSDSDECLICFTDTMATDGVFLPCGHQMCEGCCKRILESMKVCPFCKNRAAMKDVVTIQAIKYNAQKNRQEVVEEPEAVEQPETIEDIDLKDYFYCESSKSQQLAKDVAFVMDHRKQNNLPRPRCLVITEFSEYNLALCNALQRENIATTVLKPSFRTSMSHSRMAKGTCQINNRNLDGRTKAYRINIRSTFDREAFESRPSLPSDEIVYEKHCYSTMTTLHHNSEEIRGSVAIMNYTLFHLGIDLTWVDYLFIMEPLLTGANQLYPFLSRMTSSQRSDPIRVTMYERMGTFDEVIAGLTYKNHFEGSVSASSPARKKFLKAGKLATTGLLQSSATENEDQSRASFDICRNCLQSPIDEILQTLGFS